MIHTKVARMDTLMLPPSATPACHSALLKYRQLALASHQCYILLPCENSSDEWSSLKWGAIHSFSFRPPGHFASKVASVILAVLSLTPRSILWNNIKNTEQPRALPIQPRFQCQRSSGFSKISPHIPGNVEQPLKPHSSSLTRYLPYMD
jgi:hypothetical protein